MNNEGSQDGDGGEAPSSDADAHPQIGQEGADSDATAQGTERSDHPSIPLQNDAPVQEQRAQQPADAAASQKQAPTREGDADQAENTEGGEQPAVRDQQTVERPQQHTGDLDTLYQEAGPALAELTRFVNYVAKERGATAIIPELKGRERAEQKIAAQYDGDASRLLDIARATLVFDTMDQINLQQLEADLQTVLPGSQIIYVNDRFAHPVPSGYRDMSLYIRMPNGHIVSLRIQLAEMQRAAAAEHPLYVQRRTIEATAKLEGRELTPAERARYDALMQQAHRVYEDALEKSRGTEGS
ncbi:MAG TPA: hypothetical protein VF099_02250 [Ktedonobacterales bacterium]